MSKTLSRMLALALMIGLAAPALAQTASLGTTVVGQATVGGVTASASAGASASTTVSADKITTAKSRADQELTRRITALNALLTRINSMQKVDATFKANLATEVQSQISQLTTLQGTIDSDSNISTLKVEIQSITKSYRIFALVLPQASLGAAADRAQTLAGMYQTLGTKLQARIASSTGDTSAAVTAMADFNAKVADAQTQATAAVGHIANLQPDNGDKTVMQSNTQALQQARADIRVAMQDFQAARKDVQNVTQSLHIGASASTNASASASTSTQ